MQQQFSSAVLLTDLNDFISPGQECIKPIETPQKKKTEMSLGQVVMRKEGQGGNITYYEELEAEEMVPLEKAKITLNDCLACSGCITSAESVLVAMQSHQEFLKVIAENKDMESDEKKIIVVSLSSQSRSSLGAKYGLDRHQIWNALNYLFKSVLGVDYVLDIDFARDISLLASGDEFMKRLSSNTPMLGSSCPGWICYAEKTHPTIIPLLDTTKSPQQIMGSIVKDYMASKLELKPRQIYHVSIMPCYDKKLEASRQDFYNDIYSSRDVDLVLSSLEIEQIMTERSIRINSLPYNSTMIHSSTTFAKLDQNARLARTDGSSSGGQLVWIMRFAVRQLYQINLSSQDVENGLNGVTIIPGRNADFTSINYTPPGFSEPTLRFAYAYGFKNIQNLVRKLKLAQQKAKSSSVPINPPFHFVEVMACPSGCINGGGQLRDDNASQKLPTKEWIMLAESHYQNKLGQVLDPDNDSVRAMLLDWIGNNREKSNRLLYTAFHAVENNLVSGLSVKW